MKTQKFFLLFIFLVKISNILNATLWQAIWYVSYTSNGSGEINNYHNLAMRISSTDFLADYNPASYNAMIKRSDDTTNVDEEILFQDNIELKKYLFFLLKLNGNHSKSRKFVVWDLACDGSEVKTFKIKFFVCNADVDNYYDALGTTVDKIKNYGTEIIASNAAIKSSGSVYTNADELVSNFLGSACNTS